MKGKTLIFNGVAASLVAAMVAFAPTSAMAQAATEKPGDDVMRTPLMLVNPGFENGTEKWAASSPNVKDYEVAVDTEVFHSGKQSLRIRSVNGEKGGAVFQTLPIAALRGRTIELSGWLKTDNATAAGAVLTLRVFNGERLLEYNLMHKTPVMGTTDWKHYSIPVKVSKNASTLEFGVTLNNKGTVWADDLELNVISHR
ncbi:MAG: hypothetical protein LBB65_04005 [Burkholderiales bacterium]|jgi:hypothetical protein|nr:hypothetical protein [Burkholderiales bacterium]